MNEERRYIIKRVCKSKLQSILFYLCRIFPVNKKKIVFCSIEGTAGYTCNPKYIAEEFIRRDEGYELIWLVNDISKSFPEEIKVIHNTLWNRAYQLSTAHFWIDNSRKQLEVRKRKGQIYIQTWHAKLGFKPTCLDRGSSFSKIAYLISKHDSDLIDYVLSNSQWYDNTLSTGMIYSGSILRTGSPRCDILVNDRERRRKEVRELYHLTQDSKIIMYAPTFRGGNQGIDRTIEINKGSLDYDRLLQTLEKKFTGKWYMFLRLHPQLVARNFEIGGTDFEKNTEKIIDISHVDDMYEILAGCDAFITDYSSAAFDAAVMKIPVFLYTDDYKDYEAERGSLLWDLEKLPFPNAIDNEGLEKQMMEFDEEKYIKDLKCLFVDTQMEENGKAAKMVFSFLKQQK